MTAEIARYIPQEPAEYRARFVMDPTEAAALDRQLRDSMKAVLIEDIDYGQIPGADKPTLWKPGAEKLLQWFGLVFSMERDDIERDDGGQRVGVTYRATISKELPGGRRVTVGTCDGYAGYDEPKFYKSLQAVQAEAEAKERYWADRDGRAPNPAKWAYVMEYRAPWNTVLKMAQKRALVGGVLDTTAAGGLFTGDDATQDASPARDAETAPADGTPAGRAPRRRSAPPKGQRAGEAPRNDEDPAGGIAQHFGRLGVTDAGDRLILASQILRLDEIPADITDLTADEQRDLRAELSRARNLDKLNELISDGATPREEARE